MVSRVWTKTSTVVVPKEAGSVETLRGVLETIARATRKTTEEEEDEDE